MHQENCETLVSFTLGMQGPRTRKSTCGGDLFICPIEKKMDELRWGGLMNGSEIVRPREGSYYGLFEDIVEV